MFDDAIFSKLGFYEVGRPFHKISGSSKDEEEEEKWGLLSSAI